MREKEERGGEGKGGEGRGEERRGEEWRGEEKGYETIILQPFTRELCVVLVHYHLLPKWQTQAVSSSDCVSVVSLHTD